MIDDVVGDAETEFQRRERNRQALRAVLDRDLRDHFAGVAMQGILANTDGTVSETNTARIAYDFADAMMRERSRRLAAQSSSPGSPQA